ncbi:MAG: CGGC domain-containing protein [Candidatus Syntropharchaeales archaeon]|uniref:CGGC domain-containing protein n=1 Tax=Candidatus Syntropharchaeum caldarium TaxID=1838285 RepID=A0A1F2P9D7_9EURY|nr:MAG: Protein of unknown function CGGC region [Candidatus Syntrophoarchaeum caldarius]
MKIAVVRCEIVSEVCPGVGCFKAFNDRREYFKDYGEDAEIVGFFTCGGCSGRRVMRLVGSLKKYGVDVIHLGSCMTMGEREGYLPCPHLDTIRSGIESKGVKVVSGTHH